MFFESLFIIALMLSSDYRLVVYGDVYLADGTTPVTSVGGKDWHVAINGNKRGDDFFVSYVNNTYKVFVKDSTIKGQKTISVLFWNGDNADSNFEGIRIFSVSKIDVCFSSMPP